MDTNTIEIQIRTCYENSYNVIFINGKQVICTDNWEIVLTEILNNLGIKYKFDNPISEKEFESKYT